MKKLLILLGLFVATIASGQYFKIPGGGYVKTPAGKYAMYHTYPSILYDGNTIAWYEAKAEYITEGTGGISQWEDISVNGNHLTQGTTGYRPTWDAANNEVDFASVQKTISVALGTHTQPVTMYLLFRRNSNVDGADILRLQDGANLVLIEETDVEANLELNSSFTRTYHYTDGVGVYGVLKVVWNGSTTFVQWDDNTSEALNTGSNAITQIDLGNQSTNCLMSIKGFILRDGYDSSANMDIIEAYLNTLK